MTFYFETTKGEGYRLNFPSKELARQHAQKHNRICWTVEKLPGEQKLWNGIPITEKVVPMCDYRTTDVWVDKGLTGD